MGAQRSGREGKEGRAGWAESSENYRAGGPGNSCLKRKEGEGAEALPHVRKRGLSSKEEGRWSSEGENLPPPDKFRLC